MSTEAPDNEIKQAAGQTAVDSIPLADAVRKEVYGDFTQESALTQPNSNSSLQSILVEFTNNNKQTDAIHTLSYKDIFDSQIQKEQNKWLPQVTVSTQKPIEVAGNETSHQAEKERVDQFALQLELELRQRLLANISEGPAGLENEFDLGLFNSINNWRLQHNLAALEYDPNLRDMAIANNNAMRREGLGHHAFPGPEVAGWNYGNPAATLNGWLNSPSHRRYIADPNLTKMGPAGDPTWQTVHFS